MSAASLPAGKGSGGRKLVALLAGLFALPFVITALLFAIDWRPEKAGNHGELVAARNPADDILLPFDGLQDADGKPLPADLLAGRWTLMVASTGPCTNACQARLASVRQIHVALNKQMSRVRRVWLSPTPAADPTLATLRERYPDLIVAAPVDAAWQSLVPPAAAHLYVIDPAGRVVLRYAEPFDARGALHDVERLLKYSWIG